MSPTRCTLLNIFISTSLHVSDSYVPIIRRTYCIYATLVFFTLEQVDSFKKLHGLMSYNVIKILFTNHCRIDTVSSPDDGHIVARNV